MSQESPSQRAERLMGHRLAYEARNGLRPDVELSAEVRDVMAAADASPSLIDLALERMLDEVLAETEPVSDLAGTYDFHPEEYARQLEIAELAKARSEAASAVMRADALEAQAAAAERRAAVARARADASWRRRYFAEVERLANVKANETEARRRAAEDARWNGSE